MSGRNTVIRCATVASRISRNSGAFKTTISSVVFAPVRRLHTAFPLASPSVSSFKRTITSTLSKTSTLKTPARLASTVNLPSSSVTAGFGSPLVNSDLMNSPSAVMRTKFFLAKGVSSSFRMETLTVIVVFSARSISNLGGFASAGSRVAKQA